MGVRRRLVVAGAALAVLGLPAVASAGEAPDVEPVVTLTQDAIVGGELDASMECQWTDPGNEAEPLIPTFSMVPPSGGTADPDSTSGDAGTVLATWTADEAGEWGLFVTCGDVTEVFTTFVTEPTETTETPATEPAATDPAPTTPATLPATGSEGGTATIAALLLASGGLALVVARRRPEA